MEDVAAWRTLEVILGSEQFQARRTLQTHALAPDAGALHLHLN